MTTYKIGQNISLSTDVILDRYEMISETLGINYNLFISYLSTFDLSKAPGNPIIQIIDDAAMSFISEYVCVLSTTITNQIALSEIINSAIIPYLHHLCGHLILHVNVLYNNDNCILLFGKSGVGKSTLSLFLSRKGWEIYSDDFAAFDENMRIVSCLSPLKIDSYTCNFFNIPHESKTIKVAFNQSKSNAQLNDQRIRCILLSPLYDTSKCLASSANIRKALPIEKNVMIVSSIYHSTIDLDYERNAIMRSFRYIKYLSASMYVLEYRRQIKSLDAMYTQLMSILE